MATPVTYRHYCGAKGGVGTTTLACADAVFSAQAGANVLLADASGYDDVFGALGLTESLEDPVTHVTSNLAVTATPLDYVDTSPYDVVIVDEGTQANLAIGDRILVLRACFLALRRAVRSAPPFNKVIVVQEDGRALNAADVRDTLNIGDTVPVLTVPWDAGVARAVDAGLLVTRPPRSLSSTLRPFIAWDATSP